MTFSVYIQTISVGVTLFIFAIGYFISRGKDRRTANRETYQKLELASIDLFRFEAVNIDIIRPLWEEKAELPNKETAEHIVSMNYVCQILNLFEMAIRFRKEKIMPREVFGSWVVWYYNLATAPHFQQFWEDVMWDYTSDLRSILDKGISLVNMNLDEDECLSDFFLYVGDELNCKYIRQWPENIRNEKMLLQPHSMKDKKCASPIKVEWNNDLSNTRIIVDFIADNIDTSYISHGEIQCGRAVDPTHWSSELRRVLYEEFSTCVTNTRLSSVGKRVALAYISDSLVGVMIVESLMAADKPYAVLQDLVIARDSRNIGVGMKCVQWLEQELQAAKVERLFLESGINNTRAHKFFDSQGYKQCSIVMLKELIAERPYRGNQNKSN